MYPYNVKGSYEQMVRNDTTIYEIVAGEDWTLRRSNLHHISPYSNVPDLIKKQAYEDMTNVWEDIRERIPRNFELVVRYCRYSYHTFSYYPFLTNYVYLHGAMDSTAYQSAKDLQDIANYVGLETLPQIFSGIFREDCMDYMSNNPSYFRHSSPHGYFMRKTDSIRIAELNETCNTFCYYQLPLVVITNPIISIKDIKENGRRLDTRNFSKV